MMIRCPLRPRAIEIKRYAEEIKSRRSNEKLLGLTLFYDFCGSPSFEYGAIDSTMISDVKLLRPREKTPYYTITCTTIVYSSRIRISYSLDPDF